MIYNIVYIVNYMRIPQPDLPEKPYMDRDNHFWKVQHLIRLIFILTSAQLLGIPKMNPMEQPVTLLETGTTAVILRLEGGHWFQHKMRGIGIREQKTIRLVAKHPFNGPVVVEVDGREMTIGRRMAEHIITAVPE